MMVQSRDVVFFGLLAAFIFSPTWGSVAALSVLLCLFYGSFRMQRIIRIPIYLSGQSHDFVYVDPALLIPKKYHTKHFTVLSVTGSRQYYARLACDMPGQQVKISTLGGQYFTPTEPVAYAVILLQNRPNTTHRALVTLGGRLGEDSVTIDN